MPQVHEGVQGPRTTKKVSVLTTVRVKATDGGDHPGPHQTVNFDNDDKEPHEEKEAGGEGPIKMEIQVAYKSPASNQQRGKGEPPHGHI